LIRPAIGNRQCLTQSRRLADRNVADLCNRRCGDSRPRDNPGRQSSDGRLKQNDIQNFRMK